jgi:23S rRNA pseudouridine1911/1915/1917 synthase
VSDDPVATAPTGPDSELSLTVGDDDAGTRLDRFLAQPLGSRSRAVALIDAGRVTVDGAVRQKRYVLDAGAVVLIAAADGVAPAASDPPDESVPYAIAYEDEYLLVIDKPAGVVVHPAAGHWTGTLAQALSGIAAGGPDGSRAGIVHRLDRDTSGLLLVARSEQAHAALQAAIAARHVEREYLALVEGRPPARTGTVDAPIGRDPRVRTRMAVGGNAPREARTHFSLERALPRHTLLRVRLETGRTHQIRVHMQAIGHPVAGDPEYGTRRSPSVAAMPGSDAAAAAPPDSPDPLGLRRQFLHATRLAFAHPLSGEPIDVVSPLPADLQAALERAERLS